MTNPFSQLSEPDYDEWGGQFECFSDSCNSYAKVAHYYPQDKLLTWTCFEGHVSRIENYND